MWLLTEFRFYFVEISYSRLQTQYLRYKYKKNIVYGCDSGTKNILCELYVTLTPRFQEVESTATFYQTNYININGVSGNGRM